MAKVVGAEKVIARLNRLTGPGAQKRIGTAVYTAADLHVKEAQVSITEGSASGQNGGKHQHIRSLPGEAPNNEDGDLANSGHVEGVSLLEAKSVFDAPHAVPLEFGTSRMLERPFARPAAKAVKPKMVALVRKAIRDELRKTT